MKEIDMAEKNPSACAPSDCASCGMNCASRKAEMVDEKAGNKDSHVDKIIGVISGKGGVGKSMVTGTLASALRKDAKKVGILDADITGPSIPRMFGVSQRAYADESGIFPVRSDGGIDLMSMNLLLDQDTDPVLWRGPVIGGAVKQFWTDVKWGNKDYLFVDMPPGTGDVALTVYQSLPLDGFIIVTTPQDLVSMIVEKAVKMAKEMDVPILGIIENMSYLECPDCGKKISVFGESHLDEIAGKYNIPVLGRIPIKPEIAELADEGAIESLDAEWLSEAVDAVEKL